MRLSRFLLIAIFISLPSIVYAQGHSLYCSHAKSTAETQACLKRHVDSAQRRLNEIYTKLTTITEGESLVALKELQAKWLDYRDSECAWEKVVSEEEALHRANELSCLARITEDRADMLAIVLEQEQENGHVREFGSFPRWMNVAAKENPSVLWDYKARTSFDLDCDGELEYVMSGISLKVVNDGEELKHTAEYHLVVAENPMVGKPAVQKISFPVRSVETESAVCNIAPNLHFIENKNESVVEERCASRLKVKSSNCADHTIYWSGSNYALEKKEQIIQEEENKKETKE